MKQNGVAEVLARYFEAAPARPGPLQRATAAPFTPSRSQSDRPAAAIPKRTGTPAALPVQAPGRSGVPARALGLAGALRGVVEPFLIWNLNLALHALDRGLVVKARGAGEPPALLLLHISAPGLRRAGRQLAALPHGTHLQLVTYGENAARESHTWVQRFVAQHSLGSGYVFHRGGLETGPALARSILQRRAIAEAGEPARDALFEVARRLRPSTGPAFP